MKISKFSDKNAKRYLVFKNNIKIQKNETKLEDIGDAK